MSQVQALFTGIQPVAPAQRFDEARLAAWMQSHVPGFSGTLEVAQFKGGQSNPTFLLTAGDGHLYVLRKKPPGALVRGFGQWSDYATMVPALSGLELLDDTVADVRQHFGALRGRCAFGFQ